MRIVTDSPVRRVTVMAWTAAGVTALGLGAGLLRPDARSGWVDPASLIVPLVAWAVLLVLQLRLRIVMKQNDEGYATLFESHPQPVWIADDTTLEIVAVNRAAGEKYGYSHEEFASLSVFDLRPPEDREDVRRVWAEAARTTGDVRRIEVHVARDGTAFAAEVLSSSLELDGRRVRMAVVTDGTERDDAPVTDLSARRRLEADLRRAVERNEFSLRFQPVVSLADECVVGAEALIRWEHPERGTLSPLEFISVAEETGLIGRIGQWVIEETGRRLAGWQRLKPDLSMSLNVSARQLTAGDLPAIVREAIAASGVDPSYLTLEITEGVLMDDVERSVDVLTALRRTGVAISIDDFGTGYSSLAYLSRFPVDVLKVDQSFVAGLPENAYDVALVEAVLSIAGALQLSVIA
ncbi:MAG: EAL domain-containing protein, partial [Actinomycetota bacterium]|nr:EAL domain-containing protein [Actinomycetota bacterium]